MGKKDEFDQQISQALALVDSPVYPIKKVEKAKGKYIIGKAAYGMSKMGQHYVFKLQGGAALKVDDYFKQQANQIAPNK